MCFRNEDGKTPLITACEYGQAEVVKSILEWLKLKADDKGNNNKDKVKVGEECQISLRNFYVLLSESVPALVFFISYMYNLCAPIASKMNSSLNYNYYTSA